MTSKFTHWNFTISNCAPDFFLFWFCFLFLFWRREKRKRKWTNKTQKMVWKSPNQRFANQKTLDMNKEILKQVQDDVLLLFRHCERPQGAWQSRKAIRLLRRFAPRNDVLLFLNDLTKLCTWKIICIDKLIEKEQKWKF